MRRPLSTSVDRSLERVHEAHQKALSAAATLEEEIEKLHRIRGHFQSEVRPKSLDCQRSEGMQEERCRQASFASEPIPGQPTDPNTPPGKMESEEGASNLGELPELKVEVASFLEGSLETLDGESEEMPPELAVSKFADW